MQIRDRVKELRRVKAGLLRPNPKNWRTHPPAQQDALRGVLAEIGYAGALLARELPDGTLELLDGHLRAETTPEMEVPVLVVDLDDAEAAKLLAVHDPLAAMAEANEQALAELLAEVETGNEALQGLLDTMLADVATPAGMAPQDAQPPAEVEVSDCFQVVIECDGEQQQQTVYDRMTAEGFKCRLLTL
jgi:hypothetical protein